MKSFSRTLFVLGLACCLAVGAAVAHEGEEHEVQEHKGREHEELRAAPARQATQEPQGPSLPLRELQPLPANAPKWLYNKNQNHIYQKRGVYNDAVYNIEPLARDLNAIAVGHAMAYEHLVTGRAGRLETETWGRIMGVLKNPPRFMPDEGNISPTFGRRYGVLEQVFEWTHVLHAQTVDVLASTRLSDGEKDREIDALWEFYFRRVPYALSPLPMNMEWFDGQMYSTAFRKKYPRVNGLFWGYHWLQGTMYDALYGLTLQQQRRVYERVGRRYHEVELLKTNRPFMPMFAETSPRFAARFPEIANAFDNLHMLHDMVNDILAYDGLTEAQRDEQILRAVYLLSADAHQGERAGKSGEGGPGLHDHRMMKGMPGMGMMKGSTTEVMYMQNMGWMSMADCHHCSMALPQGDDAWRAPGISADGWSMRVRCALCARDMSSETKGEAILRIPLETKSRTALVYVEDDGSMTTDTPGVLFLEEEGSHARCHLWSRAFSSRAAFAEFAKANPRYADARLLTFDEWAAREPGGKPDTYEKPEGPVENPWAAGEEAGERE